MINEVYSLVIRVLALKNALIVGSISPSTLTAEMDSLHEEVSEEVFHMSVTIVILLSSVSSFTWAIKTMQELSEVLEAGDITDNLHEAELVRGAVDAAQSEAEKVLSSVTANLFGVATDAGASLDDLRGAAAAIFPEPLAEQLYIQIEKSVTKRDGV
ncbi:MAG: hypothetical protein ACRDGA_07885 [Bacteroidota bacterium]